MSTLYVTEFGGAGPQVPIADTPKVASNNVAIGGSTAQSNAFNANTVLVRVSPDVICSVEIGGTSPTATVASQRMAADTIEYFFVKPGDKLAVISNV